MNNRHGEYNKKSFNDSYASPLIEIFKKKIKHKNDFYYNFEGEVPGCLVRVSFFSGVIIKDVQNRLNGVSINPKSVNWFFDSRNLEP